MDHARIKALTDLGMPLQQAVEAEEKRLAREAEAEEKRLAREAEEKRLAAEEKRLAYELAIEQEKTKQRQQGFGR
jgi:hypothetical protein